MSEFSIRRAAPSDLPALLAIYNHYIAHTPITFDLEPQTLEQRGAWLDGFRASGPYQCFVAVKDDRPVGWACSARFKEKAAYGTTVETSIYLAPDATKKGIGRRLYEALFDAIVDTDIHRAFAGITLPNEASVAIHTKMGFRHVGTYPEIGRKFGRFWDVALYIKPIA